MQADAAAVHQVLILVPVEPYEAAGGPSVLLLADLDPPGGAWGIMGHDLKILDSDGASSLAPGMISNAAINQFNVNMPPDHCIV